MKREGMVGELTRNRLCCTITRDSAGCEETPAVPTADLAGETLEPHSDAGATFNREML